MALNTSPSFMSGKSATGGSLSNQVAGQRATKRRATPMGGQPMRPNPPMSRTFSGSAGGSGIPVARDRITGAMKINPSAAPPMGGGMFGKAMPGAMGGDMPTRVEAPPLMAAPDMGGGDIGGGIVASTAPQMDYSQMMDSIRQKMGGNTGITGGMGIGRGRIQMY